MNSRPAFLWFLPIGAFGMSTAPWCVMIGLLSYNQGGVYCPFDAYGIRFVWLPLTGAMLGVLIAGGCLWRLWRTTMRTNLIAFVIYATIFVSWGLIDIHYGNCQQYRCDLIGRFPSKQYYHTWWFLPETWVPRQKPTRRQT